MLAFFVLFLGNWVLHSEARDSANIWGGSRVLFVTDLANATVNVDKLYTFLADRGLSDVFNRLVFVQRGHDGHFIKSHGSFRALSRVQDRTLSISKKEILPWLLKEDPNVIICVADSKADVPQILISAQRKGMLPLDTKLMMWMMRSDVVTADGMKMISLISPGDFDSRSSSLDDEDRFASREVRLISARNLENAVIELLHRGKGDIHHRERRNVDSSVSNSMTTKISSSSPSVGQSVSNSMTTKLSSSAVGRSVSSSMTTKVPSSSFAVGQSVLSPVTTNVISPSSSPAVVQSVSSSMTINVPAPSSCPAVGQSVSSSITTKMSITSSSSAVSQSVSSSMTMEVPIPSSSPAVDQSVSSSMMSKVPVPSSSPAFGQSVSSLMTINVLIPSSSPAVSQSVSSSMTMEVPSSSPAVGQSVSSSMTINVLIPSSSPAVSQSMSSSMTMEVPSSSPAVSQSVSSSMTTKVPIFSSSSAVSQSVSNSMTIKVSVSSSSPAVSQSLSSSLTTKVSIPSSSPAFVQSVSTSMATKVSRLSSSPAVGQTVLSSLMTSQLVVLSSSATTASVVSSPVGHSTSVPVSTKVTTSTASLSVSPSISSSVVRPTRNESRSSPMVVSLFTETQGTTLTVPMKPSSSVASLLSSSISAFSSSLPSETFGPPSTSDQKSSVATTLQPIVPSSLPVIGTPSTPRRSVETRSTPLRVLSSSLASGSAALSTTTVILATSTKGEPLPSSSPAVVTEKPPVYENETIVIEFEGDCEDVVSNKETKMEFQQELIRVVVEKLGIPENAVVVNDIACGSIRVTFTISGTSGKANVSQVLKKLVDNGNISVTVDGKTFTASKLEVVRPTTPSTLAPTTEGEKSEIAFILYITFGALMAFIFIVGFIVLVVRCRRDRREGRFFFPSEGNFELQKRFQVIPHAGSNYSRVNYYGEPVEMDAATANPDADDEFQAGAGAYPYEVAPTGGHAVASNRSDDKEEKFNVGAMSMPEWKNLPKLSVEEITVATPSEDIPKSSGPVGSRQLLLDHESPQEDSGHAYDNPVLTFGDGAADLGKEDS